MNSKAKELISKLALKEHPEGGYYNETYRSSADIPQSVLGDQYGGVRSFSTCIYFLLTSEKFSAFHRIKQDEIWHFYVGSPIKLHFISESGTYGFQTIGSDILKGEVPQFVVPGGHWFAAEVLTTDSFALVGCTVTPGFSFEDFELADHSYLKRIFPEHKAVISRFTRH